MEAAPKRLATFSPDGSGLVYEDYTEFRTTPVICGEYFYYASKRGLICCDSMLRERWCMELSFDVKNSGELFIDEEL